MHPNKAQLLLVLTAALWSSGGVLIKSIPFSAWMVGGLRSFIAAIFLAFAFGIRRPKWNAPFVIGTITFSCTVILFTLATKLTTAANAILLQSTAPFYVAALSPWILKESLRKIDVICLAGVIFGMTLFFKEGLSSPSLLGDSIAAVSGVFFGLFIVVTKKGGAETSRDSVLWGNILASLVAVPTLSELATGAPIDFFQIAVLGVFQLALPYLIYAKAIHFIPALHGTLILILEPILNPLWVFVFLNEVPSPNAILGGAIVIASVTARTFAYTSQSR